MNETARRWLSIDGLITVILVANWIWFAVLLAGTMWPLLFPEADSTRPTATMVPDADGLPSDQFRIDPVQSNSPKAENPILLVLVISLTMASALVTLADLARRKGQTPLALVGLGGCTMAGLGFVGLQIYRFAEPTFASATSIHGFLLWERAEALSLNLLAGLGLLFLSALTMLVKRQGETPALVEQATVWHWHALDTFWLILVVLAWHWGVMEGL